MALKSDFPHSVILTSNNHTIDNFKTAPKQPRVVSFGMFVINYGQPKQCPG